MTNDERILQLKEKIEEKKKGLRGLNNFMPITNCLFDFGGMKFNIHVEGEWNLLFYYGHFQGILSQLIKAELDEPKINGYLLSEWCSDILAKYQFLKTKGKRQELDLLENRLDKMLSSDKKTEMDLQNIERLLQ